MGEPMTDEPIRITHVSIQNFRCFEHLEGDLQKLTSIVGENGVGKTALIEAVSSCAASYTAANRFSLQDFRHGTEESVTIEVHFSKRFIAKIPDGFQRRNVECDAARLVIKHRQRASKALNEPFTIEHYVIPVAGKYGIEPKWVLPRGTGNGLELTPRNLAFSFVDLEGYPSVFYFGKDRERQATTGFSTTFKRLMDELNWRYGKGSAEKRDAVLEAWGKYEDHVRSSIPDATHEATVEAFKSVSAELLGVDCDHIEVSLLRLGEPFSRGFIAKRDGMNQIEIADMGSGVSMLLTLALLETISSLEKEALIFLIDEPEMHLHPQLQSRVRRHLAASENQVIYTTHSPLMINLGDWRSVRRLGGGDSLFPTDETRALVLKDENDTEFLLEECLDDIIKKQKHITMLLRENNEMLFARCVALVEGAADKYAITLLAEPAGYDLRDITVIPAQGKTKIPDYQLLCTVFGLPYFTVYDKDAGEGNNPHTNALINKLAMTNWVHEFNPNLEDAFGISGNAENKGQKTVDAIEACAEKPGDTPEQVVKLIEALAGFQTACMTPRTPEADEDVAVAEAAEDEAEQNTALLRSLQASGSSKDG